MSATQTVLSFAGNASASRSPQSQRFYIRCSRPMGAIMLITMVDHAEKSFELPATPERDASLVNKITLATPALTDAQLAKLPEHANIIVKRIQQGESAGFTNEKILAAFANFAKFYNLLPADKQEEYWAPGTGPTRATRDSAGTVDLAADFDLT